MPDPVETIVPLGHEIDAFVPVADRIALGDLQIRTRFATTTLWLFIGTNAFVMAGLGIVFWQDATQLVAGRITAADRIVDAKVVMTLIGATTVQLGAVNYTMARATFPATGGTD